MNLSDKKSLWSKTKRGLITTLYHRLKNRRAVEFSMEWLHAFADCKKFNRLYDEWVSSGYEKEFKPSLDRISNRKDYTKDNVQWLTWAENIHKQKMERRSRKGAVVQKHGNKIIKVFSSQREVVMLMGVSQSSLSACLRGKNKTCCGYSWSYENPEVLNSKKDWHRVAKKESRL